MKKALSLALSAALSVSLLAGCASGDPASSPSGSQTGGAENNGEKVQLTFMTNVVGEKAAALESAIKDFEAETGYTVEFSAPGSSYEELMKTKMSSN